MTCKVAILVSGTGTNMEALIDAMSDPEFGAEPVLVLSNNPDAVALSKAHRKNVPTSVIDHRNFRHDRRSFDRKMNEALVEANADIVCLAGFMRILGEEFVRNWENRVLNIHPSLLPDYKGLDTHRRAILDGREQAGCTVHLVTVELDAGPIAGQTAVPILPGDTPDSLAARVAKAEHRLYPTVLKEFIRAQQRSS